MQVSVKTVSEKKKERKGSSLLPQIPVFVCSQIQVNISAKSRKGFFFLFPEESRKCYGIRKDEKRFCMTVRKAALAHMATKEARGIAPDGPRVPRDVAVSLPWPWGDLARGHCAHPS